MTDYLLIFIDVTGNFLYISLISFNQDFSLGFHIFYLAYIVNCSNRILGLIKGTKFKYLFCRPFQPAPTYEEDRNVKTKFKKISSPEKWEIKQV